MKKGDEPRYVHVMSNHPPAVIKAIPKGINQRLSTISSDKQSFEKMVQPYQDALKRSGYDHRLVYRQTDDSNGKRQRGRKRNITWFNPPFDMRVEKPIGKQLFKAINDYFPESHKLRKIFNKNTIKLSYSCMPNIKAAIDNHNKQKTEPERKSEVKPCNCRNKAECPLKGSCREQEIVYQATVATEDGEDAQTYAGLTAN